MSDFGICEAIFAEAGGWGVELSLVGVDEAVKIVPELNVTPAPELQCNALSNQAQENDAQQSFVSEYKKPIIVGVAIGAVAIVAILAKTLTGRSQ